jgi:peptide/nickel transport system substrate-binding protein
MTLVMPRRFFRVTAVMAMCTLTALVVAACGGTTSAGSNGTPGAKVQGGTATFALPPSEIPNDIFPLMSGSQWSSTNLSFQGLMYRPLYWFGQSGEPVLTQSISLANLPTWSNDDKTVTITLKNYMWSDGKPLTAYDVQLWENLLKTAVPNYAMSIPGPDFYPTNIVSTQVINNSTIAFTLNRNYNPNWYLYNELAQITPLPAAWDVTSASAAPGSGGCDIDISKCKAVLNFLNAQAKDIQTYATNPLWQVVDGPWRLTQYQDTGFSVFAPNSHYSGPVKPTLAQFEMLPFTSETSEFGELVSGHTLDVGYLPASDAKEAPRLTSSGYSVVPWPVWAEGYIADNFRSSKVGALINQLYIRQALQYVMDQPTLIRTAYDGYAAPNYGPVPVSPANPYVSAYAKSNPYPFSVSKAKSLLTSNGWTIENGTATCTSAGSGPSQCGTGIAAGTKLVLQLLYISGVPEVSSAMQIYKSDASQAGITINLAVQPFSSVLSALACATPSCSWQLINLGVGTYISPAYYPTGEGNFYTDAVANFGGYNSPVNNANIELTNTAPASESESSLVTYQNYLAQQLPVIFDPQPPNQISVISNTLKGVTPQDPTTVITPENWYFTK